MFQSLKNFLSIPKVSINDKKSDLLLRMGFCHHKCGTVYLYRIFTEICKIKELNFIIIEGSRSVPKTENSFLFFYNGLYQNHIIQPALKNYRGFHIIRDPRDIIVSGYFSHKNSHSTNNIWGEEYLIAHRKWLNDVSKDEGLMEEIKIGYALNKISNWNFHDPNIFEIQFESLVTNPFQVLSQVFNFIQIEIGQGELENIIKKYSFENMTRGRKPGEEDQMHHFRKGTSGDWKNYFTKDHVELFKEKWGNLLIKLGYEKDNNWGNDIN